MSFSAPYNKGAYCQRDLVTVFNLHHGAAVVLGFKTICVVLLTPPTSIFVALTFLNSRFPNPVPCSTAPLGAFSHSSGSELASAFPGVLHICTCCCLSHCSEGTPVFPVAEVKLSVFSLTPLFLPNCIICQEILLSPAAEYFQRMVAPHHLCLYHLSHLHLHLADDISILTGLPAVPASLGPISTQRADGFNKELG